MRKLIATTALALIIGGPALAQQATQPETTQQQQQQQVQQQPGAQQVTAQQGFYQPQPEDMFVSGLMEAQVYAPPQRGAVQPGMQQQTTTQPAQQQATQPTQEQVAQPTQQPATQQQDQQVQQLQQQVELLQQEIQQLEQAQAEPQQVQQLQQEVQQLQQQVQQLQQQAQPDQQQLQQIEQQVQQIQQQVQQLQQQTQAQPGQQQQQQPQQQVGQQPQQQQVGQQQQVTTGMQPTQQQFARHREVTQDELGQYENIGQVSDIIVSQDGEVRAVVVEVGGFLGIGAREVALDMQEIEFGRDPQNPEQFYVITQVGAQELEQAPEFDRAMLQDEQRQHQQWAAQQPRDQQVAATPGAQQPGAQQEGWRGDRQTLVAPQMQREGFVQAQMTEISADNLLGANVYDIHDENIGSVNDVVVDAQGQVQYAVIDIGGFLGLGTHTVAIGFDEMQIMHDEGWADVRVYVDATQEQLEAMPEYAAQ